jgi:arylsulfatase A-like enzyme
LYFNTLTALIFLLAWQFSEAGDPAEKPNFLFIAVDDLRPEIAAFGESQAVTPHIDRLAAGGVSFTRHYVQAPTCGASRLALLAGRIPSTSRHLHNHAIRTEIGDATKHDYITFPRYLRQHGYYTVSLGKISHFPGGIVAPYVGPNPDTRPELPGAWDVLAAPTDRWGTEQHAFFGYADGSSRNSLDGEVPPFEAADVDDEGYPDGQTARMALEQIDRLARQDQPFLLAVGFYKPHLPFNAPKKYWDLYRRENIDLSPNPYLPEGLTETNTLHRMGEFNRYKQGRETAGPGKKLSDGYARELRHAYLAATSYIDAQIGKLLDALEQNGLDRNTVVILWGDHGWHLGDQTVWGKHTLYERALRSPLIIRAPGKSEPGEQNMAIVETVDIYPTITALAGLPPPQKLSGSDLLAGSGESGPARSFWRGSVSLRDERFRIIVHGDRYPGDVELYDHRDDDNETRNVIGDHLDLARKLFEQARALTLESDDD